MSKGGEFERQVCKDLTAWWTADPAADVIYWRTSQSGGRATFRKRTGKKKTAAAHCGDITAIDPIGKPLTDLITFELKKGYRTTTPFALVDKPERLKVQEFEQFIEQAVTAKEQAGTPHWAIIHARTARRVMIYTDYALFDRLVNELDVTFTMPGAIFMGRVRFGKEEHKVRFVGIPFDTFLASVSPDDIKAL